MSFIDNVSNQIDAMLEPVAHYYIYIIFGLHALYVLTFLGIVSFNAQYMNVFNIFVQTIVCLFLLVRFHPFRKHVFHQNDSRIIFSSAMFLLFNLGFIEYFKAFIEKI